MKLKKWLTLFFAAVTSAAGIAAENAALPYKVDFNDPAVKAAVAKCSYARIEKDFEQTDILTIEVPKGAANLKEQNFVRLPIDFEKMGVSGYTLFGEADICYSNVSEPPYIWLGVKFMLPLASRQQGDSYPEFFNPPRKWGTADWLKTSAAVQIPPDVKQAALNLGLQGSTGKVSYRNIHLYRGDKAPVSTLMLPVIPQAKYTVNPARQRGVMSPNTTNGPVEKDFADLAAWGANSMRWQLRVPTVKGQSLTMTQMKSYLDRKIDELQQVLDLGSKYGIMITIDVHSGEYTKGMLLGTAEGRDYLVEFWEKVASRYKGHPAIFGYNLINEPHSREIKSGDPSLPEQYARLIKAIRKIDQVTPVIIESDQMSAPHMLQFLPVYDSPNIIYSIHMYVPGGLTHQLNRKADSFIGYPDAEKKWNKEYLRSELKFARDFQQKTGSRIYIGEFSCIRWAPGADQYLKDCIELFEEYGWDWAYHAYREYDGWSVEHSDDPKVQQVVPATKRKAVLLKGFELNRKH
jgi:hypothetical protein